eukprot:scaffold55897_cov24-Tisochrysis_lutea.AAC.1
MLRTRHFLTGEGLKTAQAELYIKERFSSRGFTIFLAEVRKGNDEFGVRISRHTPTPKREKHESTVASVLVMAEMYAVLEASVKGELAFGASYTKGLTAGYRKRYASDGFHE